MLLVTTERALWRYDNAFLFNDKSEVDFGIAYVCLTSGEDAATVRSLVQRSHTECLYVIECDQM
jgi:hypothetical protein